MTYSSYGDSIKGKERGPRKRERERIRQQTGSKSEITSQIEKDAVHAIMAKGLLVITTKLTSISVVWSMISDKCVNERERAGINYGFMYTDHTKPLKPLDYSCISNRE